jgi:hypothetical protein
MTLLEDVKAAVERPTGWRRPSAEQLARLLQSRRIATFRLRDDGFIPNNPRFPVAVYRSAVKLPPLPRPGGSLGSTVRSRQL